MLLGLVVLKVNTKQNFAAGQSFKSKILNLLVYTAML